MDGAADCEGTATLEGEELGLADTVCDTKGDAELGPEGETDREAKKDAADEADASPVATVAVGDTDVDGD